MRFRGEFRSGSRRQRQLQCVSAQSSAWAIAPRALTRARRPSPLCYGRGVSGDRVPSVGSAVWGLGPAAANLPGAERWKSDAEILVC